MKTKLTPWIVFRILFSTFILVLLIWFIRTKVLEYEMDLRLILMISIFALMVIVPVTYLIQTIKNHKSLIESAPTFTTEAKVFSKTFGVGGRYAIAVCFIAFELPDGTRKNIQMNANQYNVIGENEKGVLTYKENGTYIGFVDFRTIK